MSDLSVSLLQSELTWESPSASLRHLSTQLAKIPAGSTDIVILPEMFTTGFTMQAERVAEVHSEHMESLGWMRTWSAELNAAITGSISIKDGHDYFNRLYWVEPDGSFQTYDKRHLFRFASEDQHYSPGANRLVVSFRGWHICPLICYDLRFPVFSRNKIKDGIPEYDLLIYVANWPEVRREPWMKLLYARAIENQCYLAGVNRVGQDGSGIRYSGDSLIISPKGETMQETTPGKEYILQATLSKEELEDFRQKFPVLFDADAFRLT